MAAGEHTGSIGAPRTAPLPASWEWGTIIAVALDGQIGAPERPSPSMRAMRRPTAAPVRNAPPTTDRAVIAVVAALAATAALLSLLLV